MSQYQGFATQRGFGSNLVKVPEAWRKIRQRGVDAMRWKSQEIDYINRQASRVSAQFEKNNRLEAQARQQNQQDKERYADVLAQQKWKNFEQEIKNSKIEADAAERDRRALLNLIPTGAAVVKEIDTRRKQSIDRYAEEIYRDFGIGQVQVDSIQNAAKTGRLDQLIQEGSNTEALVEELHLNGNTPMDVIMKVARSNGYLPVAVQKLSAIRFGQQLPMRIAQRKNEVIELPGLPPGATYNTVKDVNTREIILNELIRRELSDENGEPLFSRDVLHMSGLYGPNGTISKVKASEHSRSYEKDNQEYWANRHQNDVRIIESFIGPSGKGGADRVGGAGIQDAIWYFAGGKDASREALVRARTRVVNAIEEGLKNDELTWSQVQDLGNTLITPRGSKKKKLWKDHFKREWNRLEKAGKIQERDAAEDFELRLAGAKQEGREAVLDVEELIAAGNPNVETLAKLAAEFRSKGAPFAEAARLVQAELSRHNTSANDEAGKLALEIAAENGEFITDERIKNWNFSVGVEGEVRAAVNQHNKLVPTQGKGGTYKRLEDRIEGYLEEIIESKSGWQRTTSFGDAKLGALAKASTYYKAFMQNNGGNHEQAYKDTLDLIAQDIRDPKGDWSAVDTSDGKQGFKGFVVTQDKEELRQLRLDIPDNAEEHGRLLTSNPSAIYTKSIISKAVIESLSAKTNNGYKPSIPSAAMKISALTNGKVSALDSIVGQVEYYRNQEIKLKGSTDIQPIPDSYIKLFKKEEERIPAGLRRYLGDHNPVGPNIAYTGAGYQPPNQEHYYKRLRPLVSVGNPNAIAGDDLVIKDSVETYGFNIETATIRQVLQLMENGKFSAAGEGQWDYNRLQEATQEAGLPLETKFSVDTQNKLLDITLKTQGVAGFPHKEVDETSAALIEEVKVNLNQEELPDNYWRSMAACNDKACAWLKEAGYYGE
tara:strand:+ start:55 stop:2877 length:2823 start_codon:yes stop_codon:yes gene_type:complete